MYPSQQIPSTQMPLLVQFTPLERITKVEEPSYVYDEFSQTVVYTPMSCATSSMKTWMTGINNKKKTDSGMKKTD